jgi:hypothetical protein
MPAVFSVLHVKEFRRSVAFGIAAGLLSFLIMIAPGLQAQNSGQRDCDSNAVIRCGALTAAEMRQKYNSQPYAREVFNHFGVNRNTLAKSNWRHGYVTRDGKVVVNGKTVATGAITAGRHNMPGSRTVTKNGMTFYVRSPSVSFAQQRLDALVLMKDGRFQAAVLTSCGNPVKAKPAPKPQPKPVAKQKPKPPKKQVVKKQIIQQQQQQQQVIVQAPPPPPPPPPKPKEVPAPPAPVPEQVPAPPVEVPAPSVKAEAPEVLPDTGPGQAVGISALVTLGGSLWYAVYAGLRNRFM